MRDSLRPWYQTTPMLIVRWVITVLAALGAAVSGCLSVVGDWSRDYVADTDGFVQTLAPMAESLPFQALIANQVGEIATKTVQELPVATVLQESLGLNQSGPDADSGLLGSLQQLLQDPVESAITGVADQAGQLAKEATTQFVTSAAFPPVFNQATQELHSQVVAALSGPTADDSEPFVLSLQIDPILDAAQSSLSGPSSWMLSLVPDTGQAIPILEISNIASWRPLYKALAEGGDRFVWIAAALAAVALIVAPKRFVTVALIGAFTATAAGVLIWRLPGLGQQMLSAVDPSLNEVANQAWSRFTNPLLQSLEPVAIVGIATAATGIILAVGAGIIRRSRKNAVVTAR